jgi:hypothetical protein
MKRHVDLALCAALLLALTPHDAAAYIGPGGGLSLLPMALAMLTAFSVSAMVVITWPVRALRRWLRRRREQKAEKPAEGGADGS